MHFDDEFFKAIGLADASEEEKLKLADEMAETVQNRVAVALSEVLTEDQLAELDKRSEAGDDAVMEYLNRVYPDYPVLINDEVHKLKAELSHDVAQIKEMSEDA